MDQDEFIRNWSGVRFDPESPARRSAIYGGLVLALLGAGLAAMLIAGSPGWQSAYNGADTVETAPPHTP